MEPVGHQQHQRDIGKSSAKAGQGVEQRHLPEGAAAGNAQQRQTDQHQAPADQGARTKVTQQTGSQQHRDQVATEIGGADQSQPVVRQPQPGLHARQQHGVGIAGQTEAGEQHQGTAGNNQPAVVERQSLG